MNWDIIKNINNEKWEESAKQFPFLGLSPHLTSDKTLVAFAILASVLQVVQLTNAAIFS